MAEVAAEQAIKLAIEFLNKPVLGELKVYELTLSSVSVVASTWKYWNRWRLLKNYSRLLYIYIHGEYPHKEQLKEFQAFVKEALSRYNISEIVVNKQYMKKMKECFYKVSFDDYYWKKNKSELIANPDKMRKYLLKKAYVDRIFKLVIVKLYNRIPPEKTEKQLYNNMLKYYMDDDIEIITLNEHLNRLNEETDKQYDDNRREYDEDFVKEKKQLHKIFKKCMFKGIDIGLKRSINGVVELIDDEENPMEHNDGLSRLNTLSKSIPEE